MYLVCVSGREGTRIAGRYESESDAAEAAAVEQAPGLTAFYVPAGRPWLIASSPERPRATITRMSVGRPRAQLRLVWDEQRAAG
jgi:hypothetical protein